MFTKNFLRNMFWAKRPDEPHTDLAVWATLFGLNAGAVIYGLLALSPFVLINVACALWAFKRMREIWEVLNLTQELTNEDEGE